MFCSRSHCIATSSDSTEPLLIHRLLGAGAVHLDIVSSVQRSKRSPQLPQRCTRQSRVGYGQPPSLDVPESLVRAFGGVSVPETWHPFAPPPRPSLRCVALHLIPSSSTSTPCTRIPACFNTALDSPHSSVWACFVSSRSTCDRQSCVPPAEELPLHSPLRPSVQARRRPRSILLHPCIFHDALTLD